MNTLEGMQQEYRDFQELKKCDRHTADALVKLNQDIVTAAGKIHALCLANGEAGEREYQTFITTTFPGMYYADWRRRRAVSIAHCMSVYAMLNVTLTVYDVKGETWYAGIPEITAEEINAVSPEEYNNVDNICYEKIGVDGRMHKVNSDGEFPPIMDESDVYGDGTGVTLDDLKGF